MDSRVKKGWDEQRELSYWIPQADVEGEIPRDLCGTFIRNGPGITEVYGKKLKHPIDGDGMVCKLTFTNGQAHFQSKFVRSKHRQEEEKAKKFLYMGQMGTRGGNRLKDTVSAVASILTGSAPKLKFRNPSNTNSFYWGGKILSLYETSLPHCLDPYTLETLGLDNLNGSLTLGNAGVHFRVDPDEMRLVCFSLRPGLRSSPRLDVMEYNQDWSLHIKHELKVPGLNYAHDFLLLPDYYIFHITPFTSVSKWLAFLIMGGWTSPGESMRHYEHLPSKFVVIPRRLKSEDEIMFFDTPEHWHIFHYGPGEQSESGREIIFTTVCLGKDFDMSFDKGVWLSNASVSPGHMYQHILNLDDMTCVSKKIDRCSAEFPTVHPFRHGTVDSCMTYVMASDRKESLPFCDVVKLNVRDNIRDVWYSDGIIGEPVFAPLHGYDSRHQGDEDEGYVVVQLYHPEKHTTDFCILDAKKVSSGPVARIKLKHHVPYGFHGTFTPEVFLPETRHVVLKSKL